MLSAKHLLLIVSVLLSFGVALLFPYSANASTFEDQVINLINAQRQKQNLSPLTFSNNLSTAARNHNATMYDCSQTYGVNPCFAHQVAQLSEPNFFDRIKATGYNPQSASENIAWGYTNPDAVVSGWMNSSGHRANILGNYRDIGCGYLDAMSGSYKGMYWTCDFGKSLTAGSSAIPTPTPNLKPTITPTPTPRPTVAITPTRTPDSTKPWWCTHMPKHPFCR